MISLTNENVDISAFCYPKDHLNPKEDSTLNHKTDMFLKESKKLLLTSAFFFGFLFYFRECIYELVLVYADFSQHYLGIANCKYPS